MENNWMFGEKVLEDGDIDPKAIGFIYMITQISTGRKYIGRKNLQMAATKVVKGVKKKYQKQSNWKTYWSSSPTLLGIIENQGTADFTREVLIFCFTKAEMLYAEEHFLYRFKCILDPAFFNDNIRAKIFRKWFGKSVGFVERLDSID